MEALIVIPFLDYAARLERHIESAYGIRVITRDVPDPLTGDLNGEEIHIDYALTAEQRLFLLAHLFGHTVQWNIREDAFELGQPKQIPVPAENLPALLEYEGEAASYALSLLHEVGIDGMDQWLSDYSACDAAYLTHFYRTGEKKEFATYWRGHTSVLEALRIPEFTPRRRTFREDGIVI